MATCGYIGYYVGQCRSRIRPCRWSRVEAKMLKRDAIKQLKSQGNGLDKPTIF